MKTSKHDHDKRLLVIKPFSVDLNKASSHLPSRLMLFAVIWPHKNPLTPSRELKSGLMSDDVLLEDPWLTEAYQSLVLGAEWGL